jgi:hypothetical protein
MGCVGVSGMHRRVDPVLARGLFDVASSCHAVLELADRLHADDDFVKQRPMLAKNLALVLAAPLMRQR